MSAEATCAICGRTILAGERVHGFVAGGEERTVCELCVARAERLGWRPAGEPEPERPENGHERRWRLRSLRRPRPAPALEVDSLSSFERAVARFNSSEAGRTVAGLTRTLGSPHVSIGAAAGAPDEVRITVAWELSWYQWGVDVGDELRPVFQLDKGREIDQLDAAARQWNASVGEGGRLSLAGEPAPR
ncbi:MAG TPA: hypothetical protein VF009_01250 [Solirubrobacterales bacterium]